MNTKGIIQDRSYQFSIGIIRFLDRKKDVPYSIRDQLLRSATSIGANLIEARGSGSKKEFIRFYQIALKSSNETEYWLNIINDGFGIETGELIAENQQVSKIIAASILTMKGKRSS
jgi:four helix bundle protein